MGRSKHLKYLRKEARLQIAGALEKQIERNMVELDKLLKPRPKWLPKRIWKAIGAIYFKVPLP